MDKKNPSSCVIVPFAPDKKTEDLLRNSAIDNEKSFTIKEFWESGHFSGHTGREFILKIPAEGNWFCRLLHNIFHK